MWCEAFLDRISLERRYVLAPILVIGIVLTCAVWSSWRPHIGVIAFFGLYLLQPEWNWRWTVLRTFHHQDILAIATLMGTLFTFGRGNRPTRIAMFSYGALIAFLGLAFVSFTQTINVTASWFYLDILWKAVLMSTLAAFLLDSPKKILAMLWVITISHGYNAYQINLQYFQDGVSIYAQSRWGVLDNNTYSILTVPLIACSGALAVYSRHFWQRTFAGGIAVMQIHQIMLTESRGGMLGGMLMVIVFVLNIPRSRNAYLAIATLLLCGSILAGPSVVEEFKSSFVANEELDSSAASRFELWKIGWRITRENTLLGVGPYCGRFLVPGYWETPLGQDTKALHNLFFEISTGCGLPAAILYVAHFAIPWIAIVLLHWRKQTFRPKDHPLGAPMLAVIAGQIGFWASSMFSSGALIESTYVCSAIGVATICVHVRILPLVQRSRHSTTYSPIADLVPTGEST